jgi:endonuclease/exonuclease/phosphatase (EEP) superfamily protein YafD
MDVLVVVVFSWTVDMAVTGKTTVLVLVCVCVVVTVVALKLVVEY